MWSEKIIVEDGAYVFLYHTAECYKKKPLLLNKEEKISFMKMKYDVFHFCFDENELIILSSISKRNIYDYMENAPLFSYDDKDRVYYKEMKKNLDETPCTYSVNYAMRENKLVKLKRTWKQY